MANSKMLNVKLVDSQTFSAYTYNYRTLFSPLTTNT